MASKLAATAIRRHLCKSPAAAGRRVGRNISERSQNLRQTPHLYGWESEQAVESARAQVVSLIKASPKEIIFTSGATESNNISVKGVLHFYKDRKRHVIPTIIFL